MHLQNEIHLRLEQLKWNMPWNYLYTSFIVSITRRTSINEVRGRNLQFKYLKWGQSKPHITWIFEVSYVGCLNTCQFHQKLLSSLDVAAICVCSLISSSSWFFASHQMTSGLNLLKEENFFLILWLHEHLAFCHFQIFNCFLLRRTKKIPADWELTGDILQESTVSAPICLTVTHENFQEIPWFPHQEVLEHFTF